MPELPHDLDLLPHPALVGLGLDLDRHGDAGLQVPSSPNGTGVPITEVLEDLIDSDGVALGVPAELSWLPGAADGAEGRAALARRGALLFGTRLELVHRSRCLGEGRLEELLHLLQALGEHRTNKAALAVGDGLQERAAGLDPALEIAFALIRSGCICLELQEQSYELWAVVGDCDHQGPRQGRLALTLRLQGLLQPEIVTLLLHSGQHVANFLDLHLAPGEGLEERMRSCWARRARSGHLSRSLWQVLGHFEPPSLVRFDCPRCVLVRLVEGFLLGHLNYKRTLTSDSCIRVGEPSKLCRARNLVRAEVLVQLAAIQILVVLEAARAEALHLREGGPGAELDHRLPGLQGALLSRLGHLGIELLPEEQLFRLPVEEGEVISKMICLNICQGLASREPLNGDHPGNGPPQVLAPLPICLRKALLRARPAASACSACSRATPWPRLCRGLRPLDLHREELLGVLQGPGSITFVAFRSLGL
mmetsp:Transcript_61388/g.143585  ORF Transcript_61388/g.143585 Transcript_61388/m.143585 type:complete len:479 (-) Transcript_61388:80-1516(-)